MIRHPFRLITLLLFFATMLPNFSFAQAEAESSATDAIVQSRTNGRTKDIKIGTSIRYRLKGEKKFSKNAKFKGIYGDVAIFGKDTIAIDQLESIKARNEKTYKTGKGLFWAGLIIRLVGIFAGISILIALSSSIGAAIFVGIVVSLLSIIGFPLFWVGLIMMLAATNTFQISRLWKFLPKKGDPKVKLPSKIEIPKK